MKIILLIIGAFSACATMPEPRNVAPPVFIQHCPAPPIVWRPPLRVGDLAPTQNMYEVLKSYILDVWDLMGYAAQLELILDSYRLEGTDEFGNEATNTSR